MPMVFDQIVDVLVNLFGERDAAFENYRIALGRNEREKMAESLGDYHAKKKQIARISLAFPDEGRKAIKEYDNERSVFQKQIQ